MAIKTIMVKTVPTSKPFENRFLGGGGGGRVTCFPQVIKCSTGYLMLLFLVSRGLCLRLSSKILGFLRYMKSHVDSFLIKWTIMGLNLNFSSPAPENNS